MAFLDPVLNPVLNPLINLSPFWGVLIISLFISVIIVVVYKFFTDQKEMKRLKDEQKEYQRRMKELKSNPQEMMKVQKEAMKKNMEYMKHSFKATFITILPIILIFGWMNAHLAFEPIYPGETYSITAFFKEGVEGEAELLLDDDSQLVSPAKQPVGEEGVTWKLKSGDGWHSLQVKLGSDIQTKEVLITKELNYADQFAMFDHSDIEKITINYNKLKPLGNFEIFGWKPGWLGLYIIFSIVFSIGLRKLMKVY